MIEKLMIYLRYEEQLLQELVDLAKIQQACLINLHLNKLDDISSELEELLNRLRNAEDARINYIADWLNIAKKEASSMTMTQIIAFSDNNNYSVLSLMQESMNALTNQLVTLNLTNRVLTNRAKHSVSELINILTNGTNNVCNVRV